MSDVMQDIIRLLADKKSLTREQATRAFQIIMNGGATPAHMAAFLMGLRLKGETVDELTAGAIAMRAKAQKIKSPTGVIDSCGTGGDAKNTYNISTSVSFVLAACDIPVAKHGNRSVSSRSGSADVLSALGVKIDMPLSVVERCLNEIGIAFLMAPLFHPAMRHVAPIRQELGIRTIFNLLGPLSNPVAPPYQLIGVYAKEWLSPMAHALKELGTQSAWIVHGSDGLDELSLVDSSYVAELKDGQVREFQITPEEAGLQRCSLQELKGGDAQYNADALLHSLSGADSAYKRAVVYNAAAGLLVAGVAADLKAGVALAMDAIDSGRAHHKLMKLIELSHSHL
ncbi:MAG: anthranilate phosphoribosyltransferase [Rickettsiales bacterium]|nr:anthranilate phosphoribosyltransferase [Rickettsiales bacterium]